jgi:antitoxin (DNA-binding transcriptional repressor) of toxin-antitoxin stability system
MLLGQTQEIEVTNRGKVVFYITPQKIKLMDQVEKMFGSLPREAYYDDDINRE